MSGGNGEQRSGMIDDVHSIHITSDEFGKRLGGGIPKGSIVFIEGPEGSGRSVLAQRFCFGFLENGRRSTYVSTEQTMKQFVDQMYSLSYRIDRHMIKGSLQFFPVYPLIGNTKPRVDFLEKLIGSPTLYERDTLIVDSLSSLVGEGMNNHRCLQLMSFLKKQAKMDKTIVLTAEQGSPALEPLRLGSDIYLSLSMKHAGSGIARLISVKRFMRARGPVDDVMTYRVEPRSGLIIEITEVSG